MKEKYINYKNMYDNYILLIKSGNFYISLEKDAIVMNNIFNYKIVESSNIIKVGFPLSSIDKVKNKLINDNVNYLIIENDIIDKHKSKNNNYSKYLSNNYQIFFNRINHINSILKENINNKKMNEILFEMENILCKIDY